MNSVLSYFHRICAVPHGSGNTQRISELCVTFARELSLSCERQPSGCVIVRKDGSKGCEQLPPIILQGHLDMVAVKTDGCTKELAAEGLDLCTDGEWLWAKDTSLGADDGIGVAMIFAALADDSLVHPPIEAVFTVDEETGMDGALALDVSSLRGRLLLNLDSEEEGVLTAACAGGVHADCFLPLAAEAPSGGCGLRLTADGLLGGHSGEKIGLGRANAAVELGRFLYAAAEKFPSLRIAGIGGGRFHNVICPRCEADIWLKNEEKADFLRFAADRDAALKNEFSGIDDGICLSCADTDAKPAWSCAASRRAAAVLAALPNGVMAMSGDFPGLVQTSLNLGVIETKPEGLYFTSSIRSSVPSQRQQVFERVRAVMELAGGSCVQSLAYPAWPYRRESRLRELVCAAYSAETGKTMRVEAIHAGLECGIFCEKIPGLDAVSVGPDILDIHSTAEKLSLASTERVYRTLLRVLRDLTFDGKMGTI